MSEPFFTQPPRPPCERHAQPPWSGPPENELGVAVPLRLLLVRTPDLAVLADGFVAYSTGVSFRLVARSRPGPDVDIDAFHRAMRGLHHGGPEAMESLLVGVQLADGRTATSLRGHERATDGGPVLSARGGGGGGGSYESRFWLWPLPPEPSLDLVVQWTAQGVPLTRQPVEVAPLLAAAAESERLWPPEPHDGPSESWSFGSAG
jgi:hypothetical protein